MLLRLIKALFGGRRERRETLHGAATEGDPADECLREGHACVAAGDLDSALECYRDCAASHPGSAKPLVAIANTLATLWRIEECIAAVDSALQLAPQDSELFSGTLLYHHYAEYPDARALFELHRRYARMVAEKGQFRRVEPYPHARDPERRLRIGYVSRNFSRHSVGYFIEPVIARHDRSRYAIYCYYTNPDADETTHRIARNAEVWRHVTAGGDDAFARLIEEDGIDILIDLGGHTEFNRLGVFARKPAPVQITWLGYPDTTGLSTIDYRITDAIADPFPESDDRHTERLLRLAPCFVCYQPPQDSPAVAIRGAQERIVFGCFNMHYKVNERTIEMWARILHAVPDSRLVLKSMSLEHGQTASRLFERFEAHGVPRSRVDLRPWAAERGDHLTAYSEIDVALDTYPYNGTTTTCEALWMGVPVVTLAGELHMSRVGATLLPAAGLPELVAASADDYVRIAVNLARDAARRLAMRSHMRARLLASPLLDHSSLVSGLERELRAAWKAWCQARTRV